MLMRINIKSNAELDWEERKKIEEAVLSAVKKVMLSFLDEDKFEIQEGAREEPRVKLTRTRLVANKLAHPTPKGVNS